MDDRSREESQLRSVALQNAQSILLARKRAEEELVRAKAELETKTRELAKSLAAMRATLESATDGILVTDSCGNVTDCNRRYLEMWQLPGEMVHASTHDQVLENCGRMFRDSRQYSSRVEEIYQTAAPESYDLLELSDGRVFERFSRLQSVAEGNIGRVWSFRDITERRRAEAQLQHQSEWLRVTLNSIGDAVITTDVDTAVTSLNTIAEALTGWTNDEARGRRLSDVFHIVNETSRRVVESPADRALREGRVVGLANHTVLIARDGTEVPIDDSAAPIRDERGRIHGVVLIFRDIRERKHAEEARARLAAIVESSDDAIVSKTLEGRIVSWNRGAERLFGYAAAEAIGLPITTIIPPDRLEEERLIIERLRRGERVEHYETIRLTKQGHPVEISVTISPVLDADGRVIGASKIARDITARRKAEQTTRFLSFASAALAELTDYESALRKVAALAVPFFADWCSIDILEPEGNLRRMAVTHSEPGKVQFIKQFNRRYPPRLSDPFGVGRVTTTGRPEWSAEITDDVLRAMARDDEHLRLIRAMRLKSYICVPLKSRGKVLGTVSFVTAESARSYDLQDLRAAEDLAHRAVIAIENASLLAALRETDRRKDEFLAILAHELRNPLSPIRNAVEILRAQGPLPPEIEWSRDIIDRQVSQLTRLVDDLLDVSRITRGKIELRRERVELATAVNQAVEASRPLIDDHAHQLVVEMPHTPVFLYADTTRLSQVLSNLLNNAAKYMDRGGRIRLAIDADKEQVTIRVADTGIGISREMLPRIFEMFTQADRSLERTEGGLGIGLTLVQRLVELHGGTVEAHSAGPGQGSEFIVRLPIAEAPGPVRESTSASDSSPAASTQRRILIVDDNQDAARSLSLLLRSLGHEVFTAFDGLAAVDAAVELRPQVAIMDIGLPGLNGYEAARRICAELGSQIALVALTGWGQEDDRRRARESGFSCHLTKPVDIKQLQTLLDDARLFRPATPK